MFFNKLEGDNYEAEECADDDDGDNIGTGRMFNEVSSDGWGDGIERPWSLAWITMNSS